MGMNIRLKVTINNYISTRVNPYHGYFKIIIE